MTQALQDVIAERERQVTVENHTFGIDDDYTRGELALAAVAYAYEATRSPHLRSLDEGFPPFTWPWQAKWWKPTTLRRDLVKAAALILAEIERLDRAKGRADE